MENLYTPPEENPRLWLGGLHRIYLVIYPNGETKEFVFPGDSEIHSCGKGTVITATENSYKGFPVTLASFGTNCSVIVKGYKQVDKETKS